MAAGAAGRQALTVAPGEQEPRTYDFVGQRVEEGAPTHEGAAAARTLTNAGDVPLVVLLLEIRPFGPGAGTPAAGATGATR